MGLHSLNKTPTQADRDFVDERYDEWTRRMLWHLSRARQHIEHHDEYGNPMTGYFRAYGEVCRAHEEAERMRVFDDPQVRKYAATAWDLMGLRVAIETVANRDALIGRIGDLRLLITIRHKENT